MVLSSRGAELWLIHIQALQFPLLNFFSLEELLSQYSSKTIYQGAASIVVTSVIINKIYKNIRINKNKRKIKEKQDELATRKANLYKR